MERDINFNRDDCKMEFDMHHIKEVDCIVVDKVYSQYQDRECFPQLELEIESGTIECIKFAPGYIVPGTLIKSDMPNKPHFSRVRFELRIPYEIFMADGTTLKGNLPDIYKDIVMFVPEARDEFEFNIVVDTSSNILAEPIIDKCQVTFAVGVFIVIKVVGKVQLLVPTFGFCPEPPQSVDFSQENACDDFDDHSFPLFFPLQYGDLFGGEK
ncbi:hypothetical protein NSA47_02920 [Irregularibacter muris]|uniref:Uncharacterized protein n=1 Tax=Irregularibacter muris TaxID=1796619 RepID=A0AAE3HED1_9FIRM|nr:hypothetical protein [Irregularibacter muris]MCR1897939.1 hypothetical protein [Irregularibacter muris]